MEHSEITVNNFAKTVTPGHYIVDTFPVRAFIRPFDIQSVSLTLTSKSEILADMVPFRLISSRGSGSRSSLQTDVQPAFRTRQERDGLAIAHAKVNL